MTIESRQKKKSPCEKSMQMMKNILKVSSFSLASMNLRTSGSSPEKHITAKQTKTLSMDGILPVMSHHPRENHQKSQNLEQDASKSSRSYLLDGSDGGEERESSSYIMIQGIDNRETRYNGRLISDHVKTFCEKNTSELKTTITNLKASDYIRRFHEKNKDESIDFPFVLPPPPLPQDRFPPR